MQHSGTTGTPFPVRSLRLKGKGAGGLGARSASLALCAASSTLLALPTHAADPLVDTTPPAPTAILDPAIQYQTFQGWGTSLAWWAKVVGGLPEPVRSDYMTRAFDPVKGLGLNVVRYNIGGGENPAYTAPNKSYLGFREAVPGFEPTEGKWDWSADANQRWVLKRAIAMGANQYEAFSNSPPYWMTVSGSVTGNKGGQDNLKPERDATFADYLAIVTKHFHDDWGVTFRDVEPLNEPDGRWWTLGNHQEGCFVERPHQNAVVRATGAALAKAGLAPKITVSASDANTIGDGDRTAPFYDTTALRGMNKINVHSYGGGDRTELSNYAITHHLDLWLSEYGDGDASGVTMSRRILEDMNGLHPTAWVYWQVVDSAGGWGFLKSPQQNETDTSYTVNKKYWVMANYSRFLRPGMRLIAVGDDPSALAGIDAKTHALVIVATNSGDTPRTATYDLTRFTRVGPTVTPYRTSPTEDLATLPNIGVSGNRFSSTEPAHSVTTYVLRAVYDGKPGIDYRATYRLTNAATGHDARLGDNATWGLIGVGDGWYKIVDRATGKVLDVPAASKDAGVALLAYEDNGGANQQWQMVAAKTKGDGFTLVNRVSALALAPDAAGTGLTQAADDGSAARRWRLVEVR